MTDREIVEPADPSSAESPALIDDSPTLTADERAEVQEVETELAPVSYSGTDFDVEGLVRRYNRGDIVVPNFGHAVDDTLELAPFQRDFVWRKPQMDKFIESLLLGYPIPGIMLVEQSDKRYLVLDGQQRIRTMAAFMKGLYNGKEFTLDSVADEFKGLSYEKLSTPLRRTLDNTFIQATIVRSDGKSKSLDSVYQVFERLNSGGTQLTPHEIRIALYSGEFVRFLEVLNQDNNWRAIFGAKSLRLRDQELILRILALYMRSAEYTRPMKHFLNVFIRDHRNTTNFRTADIQERFSRACEVLEQAGVRETLRRQGQRINVALLEAVVVGYMKAAEVQPVDVVSARNGLQKIIGDSDLIGSTVAQTTNEELVRLRLEHAQRAFLSK